MTRLAETGILKFDERYFPKIWGGRNLQSVYGKPLPRAEPIGEAWLVADHAQHVSTVVDGPLAGKTLRQLMQEEAPALLGERVKPTPDGRFPLLLKLLDARDYLSIQVHPDDAAARRLDEPDAGKTECWYVLDANDDSELFCGMASDVTREQFIRAIERGNTADSITRFGVQAGDAVFVPAGTIHAIGPGIVLAEIQQNSDITYRVYDWDRPGDNGQPRALHIDKALEVTCFGSHHCGKQQPLQYETAGARVDVFAACPYFAAERVAIDMQHERLTNGSLHLLLGINGLMSVSAGERRCALVPGDAYLIPAAVPAFTVDGSGAFLHYYVPDPATDIIAPLTRAGHTAAAIAALGGDPASSELAAYL
ncbi:MAG: type I phosphomannose isomerase catalytic subunit [Candidatus Hydrogenedentales bacterium]